MQTFVLDFIFVLNSLSLIALNSLTTRFYKTQVIYKEGDENNIDTEYPKWLTHFLWLIYVFKVFGEA